MVLFCSSWIFFGLFVGFFDGVGLFVWFFVNFSDNFIAWSARARILSNALENAIYSNESEKTRVKFGCSEEVFKLLKINIKNGTFEDNNNLTVNVKCFLNIF